MKTIDYRHILLVLLSIVLAGIAAKYPSAAPVISMLGPVLAGLGIALPQPSSAPPAGPLAVVVVACVGLAHLSACTPTQQKDTSALVIEAVQCIAQQTSVQPTPAPESIAMTCGLSAAPDILQLIKDLVAQKAAERAKHDSAWDGGHQ